MDDALKEQGLMEEDAEFTSVGQMLDVLERTSSRLAAFFFKAPATTEIYTLSLHDALPISCRRGRAHRAPGPAPSAPARRGTAPRSTGARKSTRLNSSHVKISYAVFCL